MKGIESPPIKEKKQPERVFNFYRLLENALPSGKIIGGKSNLTESIKIASDIWYEQNSLELDI